MDTPKIRTYSKEQPLTSYKTTSKLVPSYPDAQTNVRESRLNDKTLVFDTFNDAFDELLLNAKLQRPQKSQNDTDINFKTPLFEDLKEVKKDKRRRGKIDNQENVIHQDFVMPKQKKRQNNLVVKDKIKKSKQKVKVKKTVLLKGIEDLQLKECTINSNKCSTNDNVYNNNEINNKQNSSSISKSILRESKSNEFVTFSQHLRSIDNLLSSTPRNHKPRMVVNVQNLSPIALDRKNRNKQERSEHSKTSNALKEGRSFNNLENISFDETIKSVNPRKTILKVTSIQRNSSENNSEKTYTDQQNKITEEIKHTDKNNCSMTELLDSNKLHNGIDNRKSHESLNLSGQFPITQQNTNKQTSATMTNEKSNRSGNFTDSPLLFDDSITLVNIFNKLHSKIQKMLIDSPPDSPIKKKNSSVLQKLDLDIVNTKSRSGNTVINESSFIPDDWTNDYNSTYDYGLHKEDSDYDKTENVELNKESVNNVNDSTSNGGNISSELFTKLNESSESETKSQSFEDTVHYNENISHNEINNQTLTNETVKDFEEIDKTDVFHETTSNKRNTRSGKDKGTKRKFDQTKIDETNEILLKKRRNNKISIAKDTRKIIVSDKITMKRVTNKENRITDVVTNTFNTDDKVDVNENNRQLIIKIPRIENQNFKDISPLLQSRIVEKLKKKKKNLQKARIQTSKVEEQIEENQTKILNNSTLKISNKDDQETEKDIMTVNEINDSVANEDIDNSNDNTQDFNVLLSKLKNSATITMRRKTFKKRDRQLAAITEDHVDESFNNVNKKETEEKAIEKINQVMQNPRSNKKVYENSLSEENEINKSSCDRQSQPIFLKPGKSWARSLSIINHFHDLNGQNLEELAVGRGKNWRHSVQSVLNMQPEGALHNVSSNAEERDFNSSSLSTRVSARRETNPFSLVATSPSRISRFSMRIIPDGKRSTLTDDFVNSQRSSTISNRTRKTSSSRKASLKIRRDTLIETEEDLIKSAEDIVLKRCRQTTYLPFDVCFPDSYIDNCCKIGEGVYGEVFLHADEGKKSVIKIIPIEGDELVNCEPQKKFHEILSEIIIAEELHKLRFGDECNTSGFVGVNRIMCVIGKYPKKLIELWDIYDIKKKSENDCPSMFKDEQLYIIFELAHGGQDLEAFVFQNATESFAIFLQTAFTLAVAEKFLEFEHRDLHWGNVLISKTDETESTYKLQDREISIPTKGVKVSVIDFTLSRMSYQGCKIFNDLATDPSLFAAQGEYQFEIYRLMRDTVNNDWQQFNPYTNILWLDYTLDKMITGARYKKKITKIHKTAIQQMKDLRKEILNYKSAYDFVNNCNIVTDISNV